MSDELDSLNDTTLSEVFAAEVAGIDLSFNCDPDNECYTECALHHTEQLKKAHAFATSADAVLPFLGKDWMANADRKGFVGINYLGASDKAHYAQSSTFARAACIALIRAKRATKEAVK